MAGNLHISGLSGAAFSASPRPCLHVSAWSTPSTPLGPGSTPTRRLVCCSWGDRMQHQSPVVAASAAAAAGGLPQQNRGTPSMLSVLGSTRPVDRIRYQAQLLFNYLDTDRDGKLSTEDLGQYVAYCNDRFGAGRFKLDELYTPLIVQDQGLSFEDFVDLFRQQVAALSTDAFLESQIKGPEIGKLLYKCAVPTKELAKALAIFKLLDFNNDGFIRVDEYSKAQGIEKKVFDSVLVDADENEDGFLTFEDFMDSYSRERPVLMSVAVMAAHTAAFWAVFNLPMDTVFKALLAGLLLLRPAIITNPVIKIYQIAAALLGRLRATAEVVKGGGQPDAL